MARGGGNHGFYKKNTPQSEGRFHLWVYLPTADVAAFENSPKLV